MQVSFYNNNNKLIQKEQVFNCPYFFVKGISDSDYAYILSLLNIEKIYVLEYYCKIAGKFNNTWYLITIKKEENDCFKYSLSEEPILGLVEYKENMEWHNKNFD
jgi:hypothetical protein